MMDSGRWDLRKTSSLGEELYEIDETAELKMKRQRETRSTIRSEGQE